MALNGSVDLGHTLGNVAATPAPENPGGMTKLQKYMMMHDLLMGNEQAVQDSMQGTAAPSSDTGDGNFLNMLQQATPRMGALAPHVAPAPDAGRMGFQPLTISPSNITPAQAGPNDLIAHGANTPMGFLNLLADPKPPQISMHVPGAGQGVFDSLMGAYANLGLGGNFPHYSTPDSASGQGYPFVGPRYTQHGQQAGYIYDPWKDQYFASPLAEQSYAQKQGISQGTPTLWNTILPLLATAGAGAAGSSLVNSLFGGGSGKGGGASSGGGLFGSLLSGLGGGLKDVGSSIWDGIFGAGSGSGGGGGDFFNIAGNLPSELGLGGGGGFLGGLF